MLMLLLCQLQLSIQQQLLLSQMTPTAPARMVYQECFSTKFRLLLSLLLSVYVAQSARVGHTRNVLQSSNEALTKKQEQIAYCVIYDTAKCLCIQNAWQMQIPAAGNLGIVHNRRYVNCRHRIADDTAKYWHAMEKHT
jgi:hypothetical protein